MVLQRRISLLAPLHRLLLVLSRAVEADGGEREQLHGEADYYCYFGGDVAGSGGGAESLGSWVVVNALVGRVFEGGWEVEVKVEERRTDDIASTISDQIHSSYRSLLRIPRHIRTD